MRKFLALAVLGLVLIVGNAHAGTYRWVSDQLYFRTQDGQFVNGYFDSSVVRNGSTTAQTTYDTTRAFPLNLCEFNDNYNIGGNTAAVDSIPHFAFTVTPTANPNLTAAADSFGLIVQVSQDGRNWVVVTPNHTFDATRAAGNRIATYTENNSSDGVTVLFKYISVAPFAAGTAFALDGATAPTDLQWFGWHFVRFILGDLGYTGEFAATIDHWQSVFQ
jgi:hypothetical protein